MSPVVASLLVGAGGALGAVARFWTTVGIGGWLGTGLPVATFTINVLGSFLIGVIATAAARNAPALAFLVTGMLGGFTTFSSFSIEAVRLFDGGRVGAAVLYAAASVVVCIIAAAAGVAFARTVL